VPTHQILAAQDYRALGIGIGIGIVVEALADCFDFDTDFDFDVDVDEHAPSVRGQAALALVNMLAPPA
jgi:hypothetical protein